MLAAAGVETAGYGAFSRPRRSVRFLDTMGDLFVIKTDGLADGKGVLVTEKIAAKLRLDESIS